VRLPYQRQGGRRIWPTCLPIEHTFTLGARTDSFFWLSSMVETSGVLPERPHDRAAGLGGIDTVSA